MATQKELLTKFFKTAINELQHLEECSATQKHYLQWFSQFNDTVKESLTPRTLSTLQELIRESWSAIWQHKTAFCYIYRGEKYTTCKRAVNGVEKTTNILHDMGLTSREWDRMGQVTVWRSTGAPYSELKQEN